MRLPDRLRSFLERPDALRWTIVLALVLCAPALGIGWVLDDHLHRTMVFSESYPDLSRAPDDLYSFVLGDPAWQQSVRERGTLPWYASPDVQATFWRPLTSLSVYLDHVAPWSSPFAAHLHSLLWYAACVLVVGWLYRKILGPGWVAALATLVFAVDDAHAMPAAWVANRSALMTTVFGVATVLAHVQWRRTDRPSYGLAAPACLILALLSGEMALCFTAYIFAFAVFVDQSSVHGRLRSLLPSAAVCAAWRVVYVVKGHGVRGSGLYVDPASDPAGFAAAALERVPLLLQAQLTPIPSYLGLALSPGLTIAFVALALTVVVAAVVVAQHALRHDPRAWFFLTGMVLSAVPLAATLPHDRLLMPVGLGGAGWIALLLASVHIRSKLDKASAGASMLAKVWLVSHLAVAPLLLPLNILSVKWLNDVFETAPNTLDAVDRSDRPVVFVTGPDFFMTAWVPVFRDPHEDGPIRPHLRVLGSTSGQVVVRRLDATTLELTCPTGMLDMPLDRVAWSPKHAFRVGQEIALSDLTIRVGRVTEDGRPWRVRYRFADPLEELRYVWVYWSESGYRAFALPEVGKQVTIDAVSLGDLLRLGMANEQGAR